MLKFKLRGIFLAGMVCTSIVWITPVQSQESKTPSKPAAITAKDSKIPVDELELMLKPLTKDELEIEAASWLFLLKSKVKEISNAEITIKRKNREIQEAQEATESVKKAQEVIKSANNQESDKVEEAKKALEDAKESVSEAVEKQEEIEKDQNLEKSLEQATKAEEVEKTENNLEDAKEVLTNNLELKPNDADNQKKLEKVSENLEESIESSTEVKKDLVVNVTELQNQQIAIVDRFNIVLEALEIKGGEVESYRKYIQAISGVTIDVSDTDGLWVRIESWLKSEQGGVRWATNIGKFLGIVIGVSIFSFLFSELVNRILLKIGKTSNLLRQFSVTLIFRGGIVVGFLLALTALEVSLAPILAVVGGASFVLAFALQSNLGNFASGLMIMVYKPFDVGDEVQLAGISGYIDSITLASTKIQGFSGQLINIPNNTVWNEIITNHTTQDIRGFSIPIRVSYEDDIRRVEAILQDILKSHPLILDQPPPGTFIWANQEYYVEIYLSGKAKTSDYWTVYEDIIRAVPERFKQEGISLPFPLQDVHVKSTSFPKTYKPDIPRLEMSKDL
ncbi:MAG: mechanosensitive ion channel [Nostocaceae cyanobacterium]|nr:mechanosensitive ion channel [Nostocaceae cyanobacterium]